MFQGLQYVICLRSLSYQYTESALRLWSRENIGVRKKQED